MIEYRGQVKNGMIVVDGPPLQDGLRVRVLPLDEAEWRLSRLPAFGLWRDREDLGDAAAAARRLREETSRRRANE